jgi:hypothetical protein
VQEISGRETDRHERRREPFSGRGEIIGVDRKGVSREEIGKIQVFLDESAPRLLRDLPRRKCSAHDEQPGLLEDLSHHGVECASVSFVRGVDHAVRAFAVVHSPAREHMVAGHKSKRGAPPREQHLRLSVAAHNDARGRYSWFGGHRPLSPLNVPGCDNRRFALNMTHRLSGLID